MPAPRFTDFKSRSDRALAPRIYGFQREGVRGSLKAVLKPLSLRAEDVTIERPAVMIKTLRYVAAPDGAAPAARLGTKSQALYEYLLAHARPTLMTDEIFEVGFSDVKAFLQVHRTDRIREYMADIEGTWVRYDFKPTDGVENPLARSPLLYLLERVSEAGEQVISYALSPDVRAAILRARSYTYLELAPFSKFTSKYAARLYPILALRAGMSFEEPYPIMAPIEELAAQLGWSYEPGKFELSNFLARCLKPALKDIEDHVRRFRLLKLEQIKGSGRGAPVTHISMTVSKALKPLAETQRWIATEAQRAMLRAVVEKTGVDFDADIPAFRTLEQAATVLKCDVISVVRKWTDALIRARERPHNPVGSQALFSGETLTTHLYEDGVGKAFELWISDPGECDLLQASAHKLSHADNDNDQRGLEDLDGMDDFVISVAPPRLGGEGDEICRIDDVFGALLAAG